MITGDFYIQQSYQKNEAKCILWTFISLVIREDYKIVQFRPHDWLDHSITGLQWGREYQTCLGFEWLKVVWMLQGELAQMAVRLGRSRVRTPLDPMRLV